MLHETTKDFVKEKFEGAQGIVGVLLTGSASLGYADNLSDVDLEIVASPNFIPEVCGSEKYQGIDMWWEYVTIEELEDALKDWKDDIELWVYSKAQILHDPEHKVWNLLRNYQQYPRSIWLEKLFLYWYFATGNAPYDSGKAIQRGDLTTAQSYLNQAVEYYTALVFILNNSFVPYRKWRLKELRKLAYQPRNYEDSIRKILTVKNWTKQELDAKQGIINELIVDLEKKLLETDIEKDKLKNPWKYKANYTPRV